MGLRCCCDEHSVAPHRGCGWFVVLHSRRICVRAAAIAVYCLLECLALLAGALIPGVHLLLEPALSVCDCAQAARFRATTAGATVVRKPIVGLLGVRVRRDSPAMRSAFVPCTGEELDGPIVFITQVICRRRDRRAAPDDGHARRAKNRRPRTDCRFEGASTMWF